MIERLYQAMVERLPAQIPAVGLLEAHQADGLAKTLARKCVVSCRLNDLGYWRVS